MSHYSRVICLLCVLSFAGCSPFASRQPSLGDLLGEYIPTEDTLRQLKADGYPAKDICIILDPAGALTFRNIPDCWLTDVGKPLGKFDSGFGFWRLTGGQLYWAVSFHIAGFTPDSAVQTEKGLWPAMVQRDGGFYYEDCARVANNWPPHELAITIAAGDRGYLVFRRR